MMSSTSIVIKKTEAEKEREKSLTNMLRPEIKAEELYNNAEQRAFDLDANIAAREYAADQAILRAERETNNTIDRRNERQQHVMDHDLREITHHLDSVEHDLQLEELRQDRKIQAAARHQFCNPKPASPLIPPANTQAPFTESEIKLVRDYLETLAHYTTDERLIRSIDDLRCPITSEIMRWPVSLDQDPHAYDKYSLLRILKEGDGKAPQSRSPFKESDLKTNHFVVTLIQNFLTETYKAKQNNLPRP